MISQHFAQMDQQILILRLGVYLIGLEYFLWGIPVVQDSGFVGGNYNFVTCKSLDRWINFGQPLVLGVHWKIKEKELSSGTHLIFEILLRNNMVNIREMSELNYENFWRTRFLIFLLWDTNHKTPKELSLSLFCPFCDFIKVDCIWFHTGISKHNLPRIGWFQGLIGAGSDDHVFFKLLIDFFLFVFKEVILEQLVDVLLVPNVVVNFEVVNEVSILDPVLGVRCKTIEFIM